MVTRKITVYKYSIIICGQRSSLVVEFFSRMMLIVC